MATDLERLVVSLEANVKKYETELKRSRQTTDTELDGIEKKFTKTQKGVGAATANIAAQFQDIAVQLQGGQNPFTIALQQGTQISQVLGQRGAGGVVGLLSGAFQSLVSPISLATIGIIALGGAAIKYLTSAAGDVKSLDDLMEDHEKRIKSLVESYGSVGKAIDLSPVKESTAVAEALVRENVRALQKEYKSLADGIVTSLSVFNQVGDALDPSAYVSAPKYEAFKNAIDALRESARNGTPDIRSFRAAVSEVDRTTTDEKVKKLAGELLNLTDKAGGVDTALRNVERTVGALGQAVGGQADQFKKFGEAVAELSKLSLPKLDDRGKVQEAYNRALENATGLEERRAAATARDAANKRIADEEAKKAAEEAAKEAQRAADRSARKAASDQKAFENSQENVRKSTEMLKLEFDMIGKTAQERDKARITLQLESDARKHNITLTDEQRAKIGELADAYAAAGERARLANVIMREFRNVGSSVSDAFKSAVLEGEKLDKVLSNLLNRFASRGIDAAFDGLFKGFGNSASSSGGLLNFLTGARANGGPVSAGGAYLVGERGPEIVVPNQSGMVIPNNLARTVGGGVNAPVNVTIHAPGADAGGMAALTREVSMLKATLPSVIVSTVKSARQGRVL